MAEQNPELRLRRQARFFGILAGWAAAIAVWMVVTQVISVAAPLWRGGPVATTLLDTLKELVLTAPALFYVAGLIRSRRVFRRFGRGEIFVRSNSEGLVGVGVALLTGAIWAMCAAGIAPASHPGVLGPLAHDLADAASQLALAALGLAVLMIGRVLRTAVRMKTESDSFV